MARTPLYGSIPQSDFEEQPSTMTYNKNQATSVETMQGKASWKVIVPFAAALFGVLILAQPPDSSPRGDPLEIPESSSMAKQPSMVPDPEVSSQTEALFYQDQLVDHNDPSNRNTYSQRYYVNENYFGGPGYPIFFIFGGEDPLDGLLYPFIFDHLARDFSGYTVSLEHRFYGESTPIENPTNGDLHELLSLNQALQDAVRFIQHTREQLGCSLDRSDSRYCPVCTVGGSYPGYLSSLMRIVDEYAEVVDISYASSAPLNLYSHHMDQSAYYEKITSTAERASPGCADAVRDTLLLAQEDIQQTSDSSLVAVAAKYGICPDSVPDYIQTNEMLSRELMLVIATHFAEGNMEYYPPGPDQDFFKGCQIFQNAGYATPEAKVSAYLTMDQHQDNCFDMMTELPPGAYATISASDWSGVGSGPEGYFWDYQSCQLLPECGFSSNSMFPPRGWSLDWMSKHCMERFDWKPNLQALEKEFGFDDRSAVTRLLLTNGIVDGWSVASITSEEMDAPGVKVVNMMNGAHHSDLNHNGPTQFDTPDVSEAFTKIKGILGDWLVEIKEASEST